MIVETIIRSPNRRRYTSISNAIGEDKSLSAEALGLLFYLLTKPDNWQIRTSQLRARFDWGREKFQRVFKELKVSGYIQREQSRSSGAFGPTEYRVLEEPQPEKPYDGKPGSLIKKDRLPKNDRHQTPPSLRSGTPQSEAGQCQDNEELPFVEPQRTTKPIKGTRLDEEWRPRKEAQLEALQKLGEQLFREEFKKFQNYWMSKSGKDALKIDWARTWDTWVINALKFNGINKSTASGGAII